MARSPAPRRSRWLVAALAGGAGVVALALWLGSRPRQLLVAINSWPGYEYFYLAEQKQLGLRQGIALTVKQFSSLDDQRLAYVRGDLNAMTTTLPEAIAACQQAPTRCPLVVLVLDESTGGDRLVARAALTSPQQLLGQRVGLERGVLGEYLLLRSFGERPLAPEQLQLRFDGPAALVRFLLAGELDAIVTYPPHDLPLRQDRRFRELFSSRAIPGEVVDVLAVDPEFARRRHRDVQALVRTWWEAQAYARRHPTEAVALMAQRQQVTPAAFRASEQGLRYPAPGEQLRLLAPAGPVARTVARMGQLMQARGLIPPASPLPRPSTAFLGEP